MQIPALLNAPNTSHNFSYIQFIFTINNSTICVLRSPKRIPTLPTRACMGLNNETLSGPHATNSRCCKTRFGGVETNFGGVETHYEGVVRPIETHFGGVETHFLVLRPIFWVLRGIPTLFRRIFAKL